MGLEERQASKLALTLVAQVSILVSFAVGSSQGRCRALTGISTNQPTDCSEVGGCVRGVWRGCFVQGRICYARMIQSGRILLKRGAHISRNR